MTVFLIFKIFYYIFFGLIFILACMVFSRLKKAANEISKVDRSSVGNFLEDYKSVEIYLLKHSQGFPLYALTKVLPGSFVGFGILGTFLGFSSGISGMHLSGNVDELFNKLDYFFSGLNTAFITSIIGVILSVLFGTILYQWPLNKIKYHCNRITEKRQFDPAANTKAEFEVYTNSLHDMTKALLNAKVSIENLPEKFRDVGTSLEQSVGPVKDTFSAMQATLENYSKQAESLQNASEKIQNTLTQFIETSEKTTEKVNQSLEKTISATQSIQANNANLIKDNKQLLDDYKTLNENLTSVQKKINEELTTYCDSIKEHFTELLKNYAEETKEIIEEQNNQMDEERKSMLSDYQKIDENISSILESVNQNLSEYSQTMEKTLVQTLEEYNKTAQKVTESFFKDKQ